MSATKRSLHGFFIADGSRRERCVETSGCSSAPHVAGVDSLFLALPAEDDPSERANDADESPAVIAGIALGGALLVVAGPANHRVAFAEDLAHSGDLHWLGGFWRIEAKLRIAESISGSTFDNSLGCLEPRRKPVRPRFIPAFWNRSEASLLAIALETEPSVAVLVRDFDASPERVFASLRTTTPFGKTL
jgi:hypothetical protein